MKNSKNFQTAREHLKIDIKDYIIFCWEKECNIDDPHSIELYTKHRIPKDFYIYPYKAFNPSDKINDKQPWEIKINH